jgi:hypothetical protein
MGLLHRARGLPTKSTIHFEVTRAHFLSVVLYVDLIDVRAAFARRGVSAETFSRFYLDDHCHLSPTGHRLAAEVLGALLADGCRDSH